MVIVPDSQTQTISLILQDQRGTPFSLARNSGIFLHWRNAPTGRTQGSLIHVVPQQRIGDLDDEKNVLRLELPARDRARKNDDVEFDPEGVMKLLQSSRKGKAA
ncbi:MAG TPA: hypothetical protein VFE63_14875 [Roseiarcus sp.]|nr:hypothetical protein [Roseiarcus sp.]